MQATPPSASNGPAFNSFGAGLFTAPDSSHVELFNSGKFSDLTLVCGGRKFKVHKAILYTKSWYFRRRLDGHSTEGAEHKIELHGDNPDALAVVLSYLYTARYDTDSTASRKTMTFAVDVYITANRYSVVILDSLAVSHLGRILDPTLDLEDFVRALEKVASCVPEYVHRVVWDTAVRACRKHIKFLLSKQRFTRLVADSPGLMKELLMLLDTSKEDAGKPKTEDGGKTGPAPSFGGFATPKRFSFTGGAFGS